jgi:hypothetical protein
MAPAATPAELRDEHAADRDDNAEHRDELSDIRDQHADQRDAWADAPIARVLAPIALLTRSASPMHTGLRLGVRPSVPALGPTTDVPRSPRDRIRRPAHPRGRSVG